MAKTFRQIAAHTGMKKEAVLPPFSPASAIFNYASNSARETGVLDPLYKKEALTGVLEGLEGKGRHPFMDGLWASSPMSQVLDPGRPAGNMLGQVIRDSFQGKTKEEIMQLLQEMRSGKVGGVDIGHTNTRLPYDTKHAVEALSRLSPEHVMDRLSVPSPQPSLTRGPKLDRAMFHLGGAAGGYAHFGTGGGMMRSYDWMGPASTSAYRETVDHLKNEAADIVEKVKNSKLDFLSKKPLPRAGDIRPLMTQAPRPDVAKQMLSMADPSKAGARNAGSAYNELYAKEHGLLSPSTQSAGIMGGGKSAQEVVRASLDEAQKESRKGLLFGGTPLKGRPSFQAASQAVGGFLQEASKPTGPLEHALRTHYGRTTNVALRGAAEPLFRLAEQFPDQSKKVSDALSFMHEGTWGSKARGWLSRMAGRVAGFGRFK